MKKVVLLIILFSAYFCNAQNYQCLQSGTKHYFINGNSYLRGIRIDSVKTAGTDIIYYPFRTLRGYQRALDGAFFFTDTAGSWLGEKVTMQPDGTFLFDNISRDTTIIKTRANVGDNWLFYSDTTNNYYTATVISIDTMTVLGSLDSVKTILINAYSSGTLNTADSINNLTIKLSKNNGFIQVFDLYTFPYHTSDYFLDKTKNYLMNYSYSQIFKLVDFHNPTLLEVYDYSPGDFFERKTSTIVGMSFFCTGNINYSGYQVDSVVSRTAIDLYHVQYTILHKEVEDDENYFLRTVTHSGFTALDTFIADTTRLLSHFDMPEEFPSYMFYYFYPLSTNCNNGASYGTTVHGYERWYKNGSGQIRTVNSNYDEGGCLLEEISNDLIYVVKNSIPCGTFHPLSISSAEISLTSINLFPNPATTSLSITSSEKIIQIAISNIIGQPIFADNYNAEKVQVDVSDLPSGIYFIKINGTEVRKFVKQ